MLLLCNKLIQWEDLYIMERNLLRIYGHRRSESAITRFSYRLTSENFLRITNTAKTSFVFGDNFIEFHSKQN